MITIQEKSFRLTEHPQAQSPLNLSVFCKWVRFTNSQFELHYHLSGDLDSLLDLDSSSAGQEVRRKENLWEKTCFEFFFSPQGHASQNYYEWNFNQKKEWDFFSFSDYRTPSQIFLSNIRIGVENIEFHRTPNEFNLKVILDLPELLFRGLSLNTPLSPERANISTILQTKDGIRHYFALKHLNSEKPDFHLF